MDRVNPLQEWTYITKHVDVDTGEQLTKEQAKTHYILIETVKHTNHDTKSVEYTGKWRKSNQLKLF